MSQLQQRHLNLLIVDDEMGMCLGAQKVLKNFSVELENIGTKASFEVTLATSALDAYQRLDQKTYEIILLDYKLPDGSGLEILQQIIKEGRHGLVIIITAYATFETAVMATKLGAYDFMAKPFNPEELRSAVKKATIRFLLEEKAKIFEEEKRKIRFQFISVLSHELKAPLGAIEGYLHLLKDRYNKLTEKDYCYMVERSLERAQGMRKLIFDLLDLTRLESGEKRRDLKENDLVTMVYSTLELFALDIKAKEIQVTHALPPQLLFLCDKMEIDIILNNLISNAIKYNHPKGSVLISLRHDEKELIFEVKDSGIGLAEEDQNRLFQDFVRIKNEHTLNIQGSGLGLSTVKKIAKLYGGDVSVESHYGEGSCFSVKLSMTQPTASAKGL